MGFVDWLFALGLLFLLVALGSAYLRPLPLNNTLVYFILGVALGPGVLGVFSLDMIAQAHWLERVSEIVVVVSLFVGGLKLRLPLSHRAWWAAYWLAGPVMLLCIAGVALIAHFIFGLTPATALLLGALLAPTDPVLADEVTVENAKDRDRLRYALSGEAGLNDGAAFPVVVLALGLVQAGGLGGWVGSWALERVVWAIPVGLLIGYSLGVWLGRLAIWVRQHTRDPLGSSDFLLLALIGLSYALAEYAHGWGFLAVFAAGVGLRRAEAALKFAGVPLPSVPAQPTNAPAETLVQPALESDQLAHPRVAAGAVIHQALSFGEILERLFVIFMVIAVGVMVLPVWDWRGVPLAFLLFFLLRPLAVALVLYRLKFSTGALLLIGWFGIRGIGTLYYLAYAIGEGMGRERVLEVNGLALTVVAISIILHGITVTPLMSFYQAVGPDGERKRKAIGGRQAPEPLPEE